MTTIPVSLLAIVLTGRSSGAVREMLPGKLLRAGGGVTHADQIKLP